MDVLIDLKRFADAEQLINETLTPELIRQPSSAPLLYLRAELEARRGAWQAASTDAAQAFAYHPFDDGRFCVVAALMIRAQDLTAYEQLRSRLLATFAGATNIFVADQVAKACLFLPPATADLPAIDRLADLPVTCGAGDHNAMPFFQICKALAEYRESHFAEAAEWAQKTVGSHRLDAHAHALAVLAMADWRLGKKTEAHAMLAAGDALAPATMPERIAEAPGTGWMAWLFARIQLDEATALIRPGSTTGNHPPGP